MHNYTTKSGKFIVQIILFTMLLLWNSITAKPYLKIQQVRSLNYPYIKAEISVSRLTPILNLSESNFSVFENGWRVANFQVKSFRNLVEPKNIIIVVDASNSLSKKDFKRQLAAVKKFASQLDPHDKMAVYSFHNRVERHCGFTSAKEQMKECIAGIRQHGKKTLLYDAILDAASMATRLKNQRKFMVVFTDGRDEGSTMTMNDDIQYLMRHSIPVFVITTGNKKRIKKLTRISNMTGGETYFTSRSKDLKRVYQLLNHILDNNYLLQYVSHGLVTSKNNGKIDLEIRLNSGSLQDQDRYAFNVSPDIQGSWFQKIWQNERYLLFIAGLLFIIILLILALLVMRKPEVNVEIPDKYIVANEKVARLNDEVNLGEKQLHNYAQDIVKPPSSANGYGKTQQFTRKNSENFEADLPLPKKVWLVEKSANNTGKKHIIDQEIVTLGSEYKNLIRLEDPKVSYKHAEIRYRNGNFYIFDLLSETGVLLNDKKLLRPKILNNFDEVVLGNTVLTFRMELE